LLFGRNFKLGRHRSKITYLNALSTQKLNYFPRKV